MKTAALRPCTKRHLPEIFFVKDQSTLSTRLVDIVSLHLCDNAPPRVSNNDNSCSLVLCVESLHFSWYTVTLEKLSNIKEGKTFGSFVAGFSSCLTDN